MIRLFAFQFLCLFRFSITAALILTVNAVRAEDFRVTGFKDESAVPPIWKMWGGASTTFTWHGDDADGEANSGSLKLTLGFDKDLDDNQYAIGMALGGKDDWNKDVIKSADNYAKLAFDIRWNEQSTVRLGDYNNSGGDPGFYLGLATPDWEKTWLEGPKLTKEGWQHVEVEISVGTDDFPGIIFKKWTPGGGDKTGLTGVVSISIDNVTLIEADGETERPPAELTPERLAKMKVEKLYAVLCAQCHGTRLEGGLAPSFLDGDWKHGSSDAEIVQTITKGNLEFGMTPWEHVLTKNQIHAMVVFLREKEGESLNKGISFPRPEPGKFTTTDRASYKIERVVEEGLEKAWAIAFLPDGRKLVTEHAGALRLITADGKLHAEPIIGTPEVIQHGQGGLMEVAVHPNYQENGWIYLGFADGWWEKAESKKGKAHTINAVIRGRIKDHAWVDQEWIWKADKKFYGDQDYHFGTRIVFDQGYIYFIVGECGGMNKVQELTNPKGKIFRLHDDGRTPDDNPFVDTPGAIKGIWSYGHRNAQGLAVDPRDGAIYSTEHGPRGGDELNHILKGHNYGWPIITHGMNYDGTPMTPDSKTHEEGMDQPMTYWVPSIATCGLDFYSGDKFPGWKNDLFVGALKAKEIRRIRIVDGKITE